MGSRGQPKTPGSGRKPGSLNFRTRIAGRATDIAQEMGVDPFRILLSFAAGDWKALGYEAEHHTVLSRDGQVIKVDRIQPTERVMAAKSACEYLFPKKKSIEHTGKDGGDLFQSFADLMKRVVDSRGSQ